VGALALTLWFLASALGALNAAHASPTARQNAAPNSRVGMIAAYEDRVMAALANPTLSPTQLRAEIAAARAEELTAAANRPVTRAVAERVDDLLGLPTDDIGGTRR
jgi:hypothetical protein